MTEAYKPIEPWTGRSACETITEIRTGHLSPSEVMQETIARIEIAEPTINAFTALRLEDALTQAIALQDQATKDQDWPLLCGLPLGVKDNADLAGFPTSGGSALAKRPRAAFSDPAIAALEHSGAIGIGKTNLSELGGANTTNALFGPTANPHDPKLTAGGSSGGTAAALATGEIYLGHGNDVGGSLRTPAAFCGVTGLRPTPGLVARRSKSDPFDTVFVEGPMARTLPDLGLTLDAMMTDRHTDLLCWSGARNGDLYHTAATSPRRPERVAFSADLGAVLVDPGIRDSFADQMQKLSDRGLQLEPATPDFKSLVPTVAALRGLSYATTWQSHLPEDIDSFTPDVRRDIETGLRQSGKDIALATRGRINAYHTSCAFFGRFDMLICPTVQVAPFPYGVPWPKSIEGQACDSYLDWIMITYLWSLLGHPALSVPVGVDGTGIPVSLQLVGPPRSEARLLQAAAWIIGDT